MPTQSPFGRVPSVGKRMIFGCDYNPEQWDESVWLDDVRLMREASVNFVSVGIFAWSLLEPADGVFDYGLLDRVLDLLHEHEISVDLATGTTAIPAWLSRAHPEVQPAMLIDAGARLQGVDTAGAVLTDSDRILGAIGLALGGATPSYTSVSPASLTAAINLVTPAAAGDPVAQQILAQLNAL